MDSLITAAARALAAGDPLGALKRVALRDDAPALALRGIAMARLGDLVRAKALLRRAARAFVSKDAVARARCVVAEAEIALVSRDLNWPAKALDAARATLEAHGDKANAAHAGHLQARRLLLIGRELRGAAVMRPEVRAVKADEVIDPVAVEQICVAVRAVAQPVEIPLREHVPPVDRKPPVLARLAECVGRHADRRIHPEFVLPRPDVGAVAANVFDLDS